MSATTTGGGAATELAGQGSGASADTMRRVAFRLMPFLLICYFISFLDRINVAFAALQMNKAIGLTGVAISGLLGAPISGLLLSLNGFLGLQGWQWLFIIEGVPAILLAPVCLYYLQDRPAHARWLAAPEREALTEILNAERRESFAHVVELEGLDDGYDQFHVPALLPNASHSTYPRPAAAR